MKPLVTIIIPTHNRPQFLPRAVDSALAGMSPDEVEVIVVPNGPDESWKESLKPFHGNKNVRILPIPEANANIARNTGLTAARGEFVRFLDDDDYLIPEGVKKQYELLRSSKFDLVSGSVERVDAKGKVFEIWRQPETDDLCVAVLGPWRCCANLSHLFKADCIKNIYWNKNTPVRQDVEWLIDICSSQELKWKRISDVVGAWQHHWGHRISLSQEFNDINKLTIPMLTRAYENLNTDGRLSTDRRKSIAKGMWGCVHSAFFLEPRYWRQIASKARVIDPKARPVQWIYNFSIFKKINPLYIQWLMFPKRWITWHYRLFLKKIHIRHSW